MALGALTLGFGALLLGGSRQAAALTVPQLVTPTPTVTSVCLPTLLATCRATSTPAPTPISTSALPPLLPGTISTPVDTNGRVTPVPPSLPGATVLAATATPRPAPARLAPLRLLVITRLPAAAPLGPGVPVTSTAILDRGAPPPVAPLQPLVPLNFTSSPFLWPLLVGIDVLAVVGVAVLARRAWSPPELA